MSDLAIAALQFVADFAMTPNPLLLLRFEILAARLCQSSSVSPLVTAWPIEQLS